MNRKGILWGDGNQNMLMIRPQMAFLHPTLSLKYLSQILAKLPIQKILYPCTTGGVCVDWKAFERWTEGPGGMPHRPKPDLD